MFSVRQVSAVAFIAMTLTAMPAFAQQRTLTLQDAITLVLEQHPDVTAAEARVRAAQGIRRSAGSFTNPTLEYQVENAPVPGRAAPPMDREATTVASFGLSPLYQRWSRRGQAEAEVVAARADAYSTSQQLALTTTSAFYRLVLAQFDVSASRELVAWLDSVVAYNRVRVSEGVAAEADLIRSQLERDRTAVEESRQLVELARARAEMSALLGGAAAFEVQPDSLPFALAADMSLTVADRPDVRAARSRFHAASRGIGVEKAMILPDLSAMIGTKQTEGTTSLVFGASLPFPLFNQNRGAIQRATAERDVAAAELAMIERNAHADLSATHDAAVIMTKQVQAISTEFLARARETRRITEGAYREGAVPLYQLLEAARAWIDARRTYYDALYTQQQSVVEFLIARGLLPTAMQRSR